MDDLKAMRWVLGILLITILLLLVLVAYSNTKCQEDPTSTFHCGRDKVCDHFCYEEGYFRSEVKNEGCYCYEQEGVIIPFDSVDKDE